LRAAIATITKRLAQPTGDSLTPQQYKARRGQLKGYPTQAERFAKQRRLQHLRTQLARAEADRDAKVVRVNDGGKHLAKSRHHLDAAGCTLAQWRQNWDCARYRIKANGSTDEPFGNLTITVTPNGQVSLRLPRPLEHLANTARGRYVLGATARFCYRGTEWQARISGGRSVCYTITCKPGRAGHYLTASWASTRPTVSAAASADADVVATGPVVGVDLNDGHLAVRRLDAHGNPVGPPARIDIDLAGTSARRDAQVRHGITRLIHYTRRHRIDTIAVEDLDFTDARATGRETMGRGARGKRFRKSVSAIPTALFRHRISAQTAKHGISLLAVNPAYTSTWGDQHSRQPYHNVTRHQAAATVIGRRAQGFRARRRKGVTRTRPEDRAVRATDQAVSDSQPAITESRHRPGTRGTKSHPLRRTRKRQPRRATVTPAPANNGQQQL
jgi:IS605 OrfB family transposase